MTPELRLMIESMLVSHATDQEQGALGWMALDVAKWMTELAASELEDVLPAAELRKVHALNQVIETVSEALHLDDAQSAPASNT
jgi:hypothetical protein